MSRTPTLRVPKKKVKLELFSIHGHIDNQPVDYLELLRSVASLPPDACTEVIGDRFSRIRFFPEQDGVFHFSAYSGSSDETFLVLDVAASTEEERGLERGKVVVRKTLGLLDPARRECVVQLVHHGVRAGQIAHLIEQSARAAYPGQYAQLSLELAPVAGTSFLEELERFNRIQAAKMRLARPNYDWEEYGAVLDSMGQDSNAGNLDIGANATRSGSLNRDAGLVGLLKDLVSRGRSIVKAASIRGHLDGQAGMTTLDLNRHIESRTGEVPISATGQPAEADVREMAREFLSNRPEPTA
jgi:hypothetical protein